MSNAEVLFTQAFEGFLSRWYLIDSFRQFAVAGLPHATEVIRRRHVDWFAEFVASDLRTEGAPELSNEQLAQAWMDQSNRTIGYAQASVDAASLVFANSIVDATLYDYCRVCAAAAPDDWYPFVRDRQMKLADFRDSSYGDLLQQAVEKTLVDLERQSLLVKADRLYALCQPPADWSDMVDYVYDRDRLKRLDDLRNDVVHKTALGKPIGDLETELQFLQKTAMHFMGLVNLKYGLRVNPAFWGRTPANLG